MLPNNRNEQREDEGEVGPAFIADVALDHFGDEFIKHLGGSLNTAGDHFLFPHRPGQIETADQHSKIMKRGGIGEGNIKAKKFKMQKSLMVNCSTGECIIGYPVLSLPSVIILTVEIAISAMSWQRHVFIIPAPAPMKNSTIIRSVLFPTDDPASSRTLVQSGNNFEWRPADQGCGFAGRPALAELLLSFLFVFGSIVRCLSLSSVSPDDFGEALFAFGLP